MRGFSLFSLLVVTLLNCAIAQQNVYVVINIDEQLYYTSGTVVSNGEINWCSNEYLQPILPSSGVSYTPTLLVQDGVLYLFHQGSSAGSLYYNTYTNAAGYWSGDVAIPYSGSLVNGVGAAYFLGEFYVVFVDSSGSLWYITSETLATWSEVVKIEGSYASASPNAITYGEKLYVFYEGGGNSGWTYYNAFDGGGWGGQVEITPHIGIGQNPSTFLYGGLLYLFHEGQNGNGALWFSSFNGASWSGDTQISPLIQPVSSSPSSTPVGNYLYSFYVGPDGYFYYIAITPSNGAGPREQLWRIAPSITAQLAVAVY